MELDEFPATSFVTFNDIRDLKEQIQDIRNHLAKHDEIIESKYIVDIATSGGDESSSSIKNEDPLSINNTKEYSIHAGLDNVAPLVSPKRRKTDTSLGVLL